MIAALRQISGREQKSLRAVLLLVLLATSLSLCWWYAEAEVLPNYTYGGIMLGYDAYRYHLYAARMSQLDFADIFAASEDRTFEQMGYATLLSALYRATTPDPLVGSFANWILWVTAGWLLVPIAGLGRSTGKGMGFLACWTLYPEAIDWIGTTSKEPLVAFALACALRACVSVRSLVLRLLICAAVGALLFWVRWVALPLIALALVLSIQFRGVVGHRWYRTVLLAVVCVFAVYVAGGSTEGQDTVENPLASVGHGTLERVSVDAVSQQSLLQRAGSSNRIVDSFWVPVRGFSNIISPLYLSPTRGDTAFALQWLSAALCWIASLCILLWIAQPILRERSDVVMFGMAILGLIALGLTGTIHPRYRSIVVAPLLTLGFRLVCQEYANRGIGRLFFIGGIVPALLGLSYKLLR